MYHNLTLTAVLFLAAANFSLAQTDTIIERRVKAPIAAGVYLDTTLLFSLKKPKPIRDTIYWLERDTVYIERIVYKYDTIYIGEKPKDEVLYSKDFGSLQAAVNAAIEQKKTLKLSQKDTINATIVISGDIAIDGGGYTLHNAASIAFMLNNGKHTFTNLNITQQPFGVAFQTIAATGAIWQNTFDKVNVWNGQEAYLSSRGGTPDYMCITDWSNSIVRTGRIGISIFSQDGNFKALHLKNMTVESAKKYGNNIVSFRADTNYQNHTLYAHPNVALRFDSVNLISGNLSLHHYSGGGVAGVAKYIEISKVKAGLFELNTVGDGRGIEALAKIDSSDFAPYVTGGNAPANVYATNSTFRNLGNGALLRGKVENCKGQVWSPGIGYSVEISNSTMNEVSTRPGGNVTITNSVIGLLWGADRGNPFSVKLVKSTVGTLSPTNGLGLVEMDAESVINRRL